MSADNELIRRGLPLIALIAARLARRLRGYVHVDDLTSMGHVALFEIARKYEPSRSTFEKYASHKLKWAMLDGVRRDTHSRAGKRRLRSILASERFGEGAEPERDAPTTQEEDQAALRAYLRGKAMAIALPLLATDDEEGTPEARVARAQSFEATRKAVRSLPERERILVERHYFGDEPFDVVARDLGISKSWASRLHDRALTMLYTSLHDDVA